MDQKIAPKDLIVGEKYFIKTTNCFQEFFNGTFKCLIHNSRNINYSGRDSDYGYDSYGEEEEEAAEEEEEEEDYGYCEKQKQHEKENTFIVGNTMLWYSVHMVNYKDVVVEFDCRSHAFYKYVIV